MNGTVSFACISDTFNGFCYVMVQSLAVDIRESSVSGCVGTDNTLVLAGADDSPNLCSVTSLNASANNADSHGSALAAWDFSPVAFRNCAFCGNWPRNCLEFGARLGQEDISCLIVLNNSCQSSRTSPGLISVAAELTVSKCLFRANRFDYFIGTRPDMSGRVWFVGCAWDITAISTSNSVRVAAAECVVAAWPTAPAECHVREATGSPIWPGVVLTAVALCIVARYWWSATFRLGIGSASLKRTR
jgi:hypothetical protein